MSHSHILGMRTRRIVDGYFYSSYACTVPGCSFLKNPGAITLHAQDPGVKAHKEFEQQYKALLSQGWHVLSETHGDRRHAVLVPHKFLRRTHARGRIVPLSPSQPSPSNKE